MGRYRYPGVRPFDAGDSDLFFGRNEDARDLVGLIRQEKLVVLFSKSGYGKSSLINAAVIPELERAPDTFVFPIRISGGVEEDSLSRLILSHLGQDKRIGANSEMAFLEGICKKKTLWYHAKMHLGAATKWIFVFDQFEEYFHYKVQQRRRLEEELAELLYTQVPQEILDASDSLDDEKLDLLLRPMDVRILLSLRADRLSELDSMTLRLPDILHKRIELKPLSYEQAREAISKPAMLRADDFNSPRYEYTVEALDIMLAKLSTPGGIESFQLQIVCDYIDNLASENKLIDRTGDDIPDVFPQDLPDFDLVYQLYYQRRIEGLPKDMRSAAFRLIEDDLIYEDASSGDIRRVGVDEGVLTQKALSYGAPASLLNKLVDSFLLRRENNLLRGFSYEVSHDTLLPTILISRKIRKENEDREREEKTRIEDQAKYLKEKESKEEAQRLRQEADISREIAVAAAKRATTQRKFATATAVICVLLAGWAFRQFKRSEVMQEELLRQKSAIEINEARTSKQNTLLKKVMEERDMEEANRVITQIQDIRNRAEKIKGTFPDISKQMMHEIDVLLASYPDNKLLQEKFENTKP